MSAEVILGVVAIVVSVLTALWTAYSTWQHGVEEKLTAAARAQEALHTMYSKDAQKAMTFISIFARVPGTQDFNENLADFMRDPRHTTWNELCGNPPAVGAPLGNVLVVNQEARETWLAIREACQVAEGFWDFVFEQADHGHLPDKMIKVDTNGLVRMKGRWYRRAGNFRKFVEPLAEANLAFMNADTVYASHRPGRYEKIENMEILQP